VKAVLDAGALIAIDRQDRNFGARLRVLQRQGMPLRASAAAVAQAWRDGSRQANLARVLTGVGIAPLAAGDSKRIGELLAAARTADFVDGHVALLADPGDIILTSDPADLAVLIEARGITASVHAV
jgi:hypothetical protein